MYILVNLYAVSQEVKPFQYEAQYIGRLRWGDDRTHINILVPCKSLAAFRIHFRRISRNDTLDSQSRYSSQDTDQATYR